jgi:hypothetical protein
MFDHPERSRKVRLIVLTTRRVRRLPEATIKTKITGGWVESVGWRVFERGEGLAPQTS